MPGGRLTEDDRRCIADGLAEGLGYAEIARRLDRPTSTVSREVARNGGAHRYRADHAQLATASRARRRGPVPAAAPIAPGRGSAELREVERRLVDSMIQMGTPRMACNVLASLYLSDDGLTSAELVARLRVSSASISKAIGYLEGLEMVRREQENSRRRERYFIDEDMWIKLWEANIRQNAMMAAAARDGAHLLDGTPAGSRLLELSEIFSWLHDNMVRMVDELGAMLEQR
jgi:predicted transcriptional regulator